jgi:hypothetical protein
MDQTLMLPVQSIGTRHPYPSEVDETKWAASIVVASSALHHRLHSSLRPSSSASSLSAKIAVAVVFFFTLCRLPSVSPLDSPVVFIVGTLLPPHPPCCCEVIIVLFLLSLVVVVISSSFLLAPFNASRRRVYPFLSPKHRIEQTKGNNLSTKQNGMMLEYSN